MLVLLEEQALEQLRGQGPKHSAENLALARPECTVRWLPTMAAGLEDSAAVGSEHSMREPLSLGQLCHMYALYAKAYRRSSMDKASPRNKRSKAEERPR